MRNQVVAAKSSGAQGLAGGCLNVKVSHSVGAVSGRLACYSMPSLHPHFDRQSQETQAAAGTRTGHHPPPAVRTMCSLIGYCGQVPPILLVDGDVTLGSLFGEDFKTQVCGT